MMTDLEKQRTSRWHFWWRYLWGQTPWDTGIVPPEIVRLADSMPPGRALDVGCGTGTTSIFLAQRGWHSVGVDFVQGAIQKARRKAARAADLKGSVEFFVADATRLAFLQEPFELVIDIGTLHALNEDGQHALAQHLTRLTRPGAVYALYAFLPQLDNGRIFGISPEDVAARFKPAFQVESTTLGTDRANGADSAWYMLRRV
jgi:SAM-dependent methyltransferase